MSDVKVFNGEARGPLQDLYEQLVEAMKLDSRLTVEMDDTHLICTIKGNASSPSESIDMKNPAGFDIKHMKYFIHTMLLNDGVSDCLFVDDAEFEAARDTWFPPEQGTQQQLRLAA